MVLYVMRWNIHPDKKEAYTAWTKGAISGTVGAGGVVEFRAYRPATGSSQVAVTYEFADMAAWEGWYSNEAVQAVLEELHTLATDISLELWGPSPVVPDPIRPGA
jgi:quinol monooxygenase YgiN